MQIFMLILNMISILFRMKVLIIKILEYEPMLMSFRHHRGKITFLNNNTILSKKDTQFSCQPYKEEDWKERLNKYWGYRDLIDLAQSSFYWFFCFFSAIFSIFSQKRSVRYNKNIISRCNSTSSIQPCQQIPPKTLQKFCIVSTLLCWVMDLIAGIRTPHEVNMHHTITWKWGWFSNSRKK